MEAFWCAHGPAGVTLYNFATPRGARQPTRKRKPLAMVKQHHARFRTAADTLQLTGAGQAQHDDTVVWAETHACKGDGNCLKRRGKCSEGFCGYESLSVSAALAGRNLCE